MFSVTLIMTSYNDRTVQTKAMFHCQYTDKSSTLIVKCFTVLAKAYYLMIIIK